LGAVARFTLDDLDFAPFLTARPELPPPWRDHLREHDLIISYLHDREGIFERNVRSCEVKKFVAGPHRIESGSHATTQLARPLEQLGIPISDFAPRIELSYSERRTVEATCSLIALHPGSGSLRKNWPIENWIALIDELLSVAAVAGCGSSSHALAKSMPRPATAATTRVTIIGGEADGEEITRIRERFGDRVRYAIDWPLRRLAALLANTDFIGHDSGISHLAAAVGARCLVLFGPTDPKTWAPRNEKVRVLVAPNKDLRQLTLEEVHHAFGLTRLRSQ
jgi:heptosyltransferase III